MIKVLKQPRLLKVWIEETLHTYIVGKIISIQSWKNEDNYFIIQYQTKSTTTTCEYVSIDTWSEILKQLDNQTH
jgi:hypothetical protein